MSGPHPPAPPDGPGGLVVMIRDQPSDAARALATDLDAELAIGGEATEAALARLRRTTDPVDVPAVPVSERDFAALGQAMRRAEDVRERTRVRVAQQLSQTINTALAIHPDTMRRAADELLAARAALARACRGLPDPSERAGRRIRVAGSGGLAASGVAIAALGVPPVGAIVIAVGVISGGVTWRAARSATRRTVPGLAAAEALARRRWEQLAGGGADPSDVDAVVRLYDPQHRIVTDLLVHHPAVRAADQVAAHHRMAWVQAWRDEVGDDGAPASADPPHVAVIAEPGTVAGGSVPAMAEEERATTLVVAAPYADLSEQRARALHRRLLALPPGHRVIVVLGPETVIAEPP
ncbi:MAG: hypothetical protein JWM47_2749, partial [Acidimicrobiales bacterium]|nr:hypothetical protein [Acidimicrobiales bacterium]